ncbi:MAG: hypothetical protein E7309_03850 [Butyrivibrio sp.]|nr:hypothetical protein [Butyrivibrio sp.]MBQ7429228.1 hypothetical protein [Butyrivibrio sp.]MCR4833021.1 DUF6142 family protein [Butyrivibrio sp.]
MRIDFFNHKFKRPKIKIRPRFLWNRYMFTDNKHPDRGIMSSILGVISVVTIIVAIVLTYNAGGQAGIRSGAAVFLATCFSIVGLILGIKSRFEKDIFKFFPNFGISINSIVILFMIYIMVISYI